MVIGGDHNLQGHWWNIFSMVTAGDHILHGYWWRSLCMVTGGDHYLHGHWWRLYLYLLVKRTFCRLTLKVPVTAIETG